MAMGLGGLDQAGDDGACLAAAFAASEQPILSPDRDFSQRVRRRCCRWRRHRCRGSESCSCWPVTVPAQATQAATLLQGSGVRADATLTVCKPAIRLRFLSLPAKAMVDGAAMARRTAGLTAPDGGVHSIARCRARQAGHRPRGATVARPLPHRRCPRSNSQNPLLQVPSPVHSGVGPSLPALQAEPKAVA